MVVTRCSTSTSTGAAALIEEPGSQLVVVEFGSRIDSFGNL